MPIHQGFYISRQHFLSFSFNIQGVALLSRQLSKLQEQFSRCILKKRFPKNHGEKSLKLFVIEFVTKQKCNLEACSFV